MIAGMKARLIGICVALANLVWTPLLWAKSSEPEAEVVDARLENFPQNVTLEGHSTALTYFLLVFLAAVCLAGLFKDAKRTHLD